MLLSTIRHLPFSAALMRVSVTGRSKSTPDTMRSVSLLFSFRDAASSSFTFAAKYHALP